MFFSKLLTKYKKVNHCFFSRKNGFSKGIYTSLNCGMGSKDRKDHVSKNLEFVCKKLGVKDKKLVLMTQTHSNKVLIVDENNFKLTKFKADAIITKAKGIALGVLTADCVPIILYDQKNNIIASIHAGWRGCISGIIDNTVNKMKELGQDNSILASVGPCIGNQSYEVDEDFCENFKNQSVKNSLFFKSKGNKKLLFDIRAFVNKRLELLGVKDIDNIEMDTFQDPDNFYSYRRSKKLQEPDYGRCISTICLKT
tara:strand:- start:5883 stop:6644 length:762 start_codon:yes stop_codon:yes gene_type:complete